MTSPAPARGFSSTRCSGLAVLLLLALPACSAHGTSTAEVRELPFSDGPHEGCAPFFTVSGAGASQAAARARVFETVAAGGGNAVVCVGATVARDPATGRAGSRTERGLAYDCTAGEMELREAALRVLIGHYDALEEQFDDPVGRRYCLAFDETVEAEGVASPRTFSNGSPIMTTCTRAVGAGGTRGGCPNRRFHALLALRQP